ncbi:MAG TPA: hypothetical protein VJ746_17965 [Nitrospira sp.]|nr:hypothetical protein [Nitrospira sp.]
MKLSFATRSLAALLVFCLVAVGGLAAAQSIVHETQHAHHQKTDHGTVLCSWMCTAGHALDSVSSPASAEQSPIALAEPSAFRSIPRTVLESPTSRGPPSFPA